MQEYPSHYKIIKNIANAKVSVIIYDDQVRLSSFYPKSELEIESVDIVDNIVNIYAHGSLEHGFCPYCGTKSCKVHSRYIRHVYDLPILGKSSVLHLRMHKFFCMNPECKYRTFAEQPGIEIFRYCRRTRRCEIVQYGNALKHSSNTSHKLLSGQGICLSSSAILRDLHRLIPSSHLDVRRIGIDDWAQKKGRVYGSIIVDLDQSTVIDLLDDREQESFGAWLNKHRSVELASRDRSTDYSAAIASSGRKITEVADKGYKPTKTERIMDERSELLPIKTLASVVFSYMSGKKLDDENRKLMKLLQRADWFNQMYEATCSFCCLVKGNDSMNLIRWMKKYWKTNITQLKIFIRGIKLDYKAVKKNDYT